MMDANDTDSKSFEVSTKHHAVDNKMDLVLDLRESQLFVREIERSDGTVLSISQCNLGDVGCVVWDAALVLAHYIDSPAMMDPQIGTSVLVGKSVVELGAGTGVVGIQAGACG